MSKSKESQSSTTECPFCEEPCKNKWCEYTQKFEDEDRETQEQSVQ